MGGAEVELTYWLLLSGHENLSVTVAKKERNCSILWSRISSNIR